MLRSVRLWAALCGAVLVLALLVSGSQNAHAQPNKPKPPKTPDALITTTGTLVTETVAGENRYLLKDASGTTIYRLEAGPPWYYANGAYPLNKYVGKQVTVQGVIDNGNGNGNGKAKGKNKGNSGAQQAQSNVPGLEVYVINGETIRGPGKPPWAGGPKSNPNHPGNNGNGNAKNKNKNSQKP